jgi:Fe-S cluster assembly protein SufD
MAISESAFIQEKFSALQTQQADGVLNEIRLKAFENFQVNGIPSYKNEEWRYTPVSQLFKKPYELSEKTVSIEQQFLQQTRLPNSNEANELIYVNGVYDASLSNIRSKELVVLPLEKALSDSTYAEMVNAHLGKSSLYIKDGVHALNTSFINGGVFVYVPKNAQIDLPFYVYHLCNTQKNPVLVQPRSLVYISESASLKIVEHYATIGNTDSLINEVMEVVVAENAQFEYYKLQADVANANQVNTTHIRQIGKSFVHTVVATLTGGMLRNNTNIIMEKAGNEAHMYGLYLLNGSTHADNHTLVDNREPNCFSNELYKGILDGSSTGVFRGKIYVRPQAQKTNAYQSNKNILLSDNASVNTKPQLEIFANDVKCSHGCTVGRLDE